MQRSGRRAGRRSTPSAGARSRGLDRGLHARDAALLRGMVLGRDERLDEEVGDDFRRSGLAHLLAVIRRPERRAG
jgi:hypothetical protein